MSASVGPVPPRPRPRRMGKPGSPFAQATRMACWNGVRRPAERVLGITRQCWNRIQSSVVLSTERVALCQRSRSPRAALNASTSVQGSVVKLISPSLSRGAIGARFMS